MPTETDARAKLETAIEREVYKFVSQLKEHMYDYTMIYLNRTQSDIDRVVADRILQVAKNAVEDGFMTKVDFFKKAIDEPLDHFTETDSNPLPLGESGKKEKR